MSRVRETGVLVYPTHSRRSGGLSLGINLFPSKKFCTFNCPYCEVFPFSNDAAFSLTQMDLELRSAVAVAKETDKKIMDICFSGCGEPSISPDFPGALELAGRIRDEEAAGANLVLITNGTGLLLPNVFSVLAKAATGSPALDIWLKLDAGTWEWYRKINAAEIAHDKLTKKIKEFAACATVTIQTMLCEIDGAQPPKEEEQAWENLVCDLAAGNGNIRKVQIYGKSRSSPGDPKTVSLPASYLEQRAQSLRLALASVEADAATTGLKIPVVEVYP
jgi:histidinol dehydrogenase